MSDLRALLDPTSVAVVGASEGPRHGAEIMRSLLKLGYPGKIFPINPKYDKIYDLPCYHSLKDLPGPAECVVVAVGSQHVLDTVEEAAQVGAKAALVITAGFAEAGEEGKKLQQRLRQLARECGLRICGPNSLGFVNLHSRVALYSGALPETLCAGGVGVVAQSGSVCSAIGGAGRGLGFSYVISSGNEADVCASEYMEFLVDDPRTQVILGFIEGFKEPERFVQTAEAALKKGKPIIILKVGRTEQSRRVTLTHTGSLSGSDAVHDAVFRQKGVIRVADLDELLEVGELFWGLRGKLLEGDGVGMIAISGGETAMIHDLSEESPLHFPSLADTTKAELRKVLPEYAVIGNPLDVTGAGAVDRALYTKALNLLCQDDDVHLIAVMQDIRQGHWITPEIAGTVVNAARQNSKPFLFFTNVSRGLSQQVQDILISGNVPLLQGARESVKAMSSLAWYSRLRRARLNVPPANLASSIASDQIRTSLKEQTGALGEHESKALLSQYGIPVCQEYLCTTMEEAQGIASKIGFPIVLKVASPQIPHKTDVGAIELGINSHLELAQAWNRITENVRTRAPQAEVKGVLVQEMLSGGTEVIVGTARDPQFGLTVLFGLGGVFVEVLRDVALRVLPITRNDAEDMISEIRARQILLGARGRPRLDLEALVDVILMLSNLALDCQDLIGEIDINPLLVFPQGKGCVAVDALVALARPRS